jgi:hypothetical protein
LGEQAQEKLIVAAVKAVRASKLLISKPVDRIMQPGAINPSL